jgi:hypothetical protein
MNTYSLSLASSSSQFASRADTASLSITGNMTYEGWHKFTSLPAPSSRFCFIAKYVPSGDQRSYVIELTNTAGQLAVQFTSGTGTGATSKSINVTLSTATWYHLAVVYTAASGGLEVFLNAVSQGTATGLDTSIYDGNSGFYLGSFNNTSEYFDGQFDDVRLWAAARTSTQIVDNYKTELIGNESGLNAYWKMENNYNDTTANANNMTGNGTFSTDVPSWTTNNGTLDLTSKMW